MTWKVSKPVSEVRQSKRGNGKYQERRHHLTDSSSDGIMGITWAKNGSAAPAMHAAGAEEYGKFAPESLT